MRRRHAARSAILIVAVVVAVVPAWGAPSNYSVPPLQDGDTLAVSCAGSDLAATVVDATHQTLTCTTAAPTTTLAPASTSTSTTTLATTTTVAPTTTAPGAQFTDSFVTLDNWTFAHWRNQIPGNADAASSASIVGGQAQIVSADENYGDATLRSNTRYALGELRVTLGDNTEGFPLLGSAFVGLTTDPYNAPSIQRDNGNGPTPANGVLIHLRDNCRVPWGPPQGSVYVNHVETVVAGNCVGPQPTGSTDLRVTAGHVEFWSAGAKYADMILAIPATGYLLLGVHNHASSKYSDGPGPMPSVIGVFDDITYPAAGAVANYRNGVGVTSVGTSARVLFNAYSLNFPSGAAVVVNGHSHPFVPFYPGGRSVAESVAIPVSELGVGTNTITIVGFDVVANVDLLVS